MKIFSRIRFVAGLIFISLHLQNCNPGGYFKELSGNYSYEDRGPDAKNIVCHLPGYKSVYANVIAYDYNSEFIVAKQQPNIEGYKNMIGFELRDNLKEYPTNSKFLGMIHITNPSLSTKSITGLYHIKTMKCTDR